MFYEEYILYPEEEDPRAEYVSDELKIYYYMSNMIEGTHDFMDTVTHEWLHGLFDWATEGAKHEEEKIDADGEHFIMRLMNFKD
jgi:hypothetical protein